VPTNRHTRTLILCAIAPLLYRLNEKARSRNVKGDK